MKTFDFKLSWSKISFKASKKQPKDGLHIFWNSTLSSRPHYLRSINLENGYIEIFNKPFELPERDLQAVKNMAMTQIFLIKYEKGILSEVFSLEENSDFLWFLENFMPSFY